MRDFTKVLRLFKTLEPQESPRHYEWCLGGRTNMAQSSLRFKVRCAKSLVDE